MSGPLSPTPGTYDRPVLKVDIALVVVVLALVVTFLLARSTARWTARQVAVAAERVADVRGRLLPPGPRRDAVGLRAALEAEMRATRDMMRSAPQELVFRADAAALMHDLDEMAESLRGELAGIEAFRDSAQQRAALAVVRPQIEQLVETTYRARQTIVRTSAEDRDRQLQRLRAGVDQQAAALELYRNDGGQLSL